MSAHVIPSSSSIEASVRVAVIGCGVGARHVEAYQTLGHLFQVVALVNSDGGQLERVAHRFGH